MAKAVWLNPAGGSWTDAANWLGNAVPNSTGVTADFSMLDLPANATVTLTSPTTVGTLLFGDTVPDFDWTMGPGGPLTLDAPGVPVIHVANQITTVASAIGGTKGLRKTGDSLLRLSAENSFNGTMTVEAGQVDLNAAPGYGRGFAGTNVGVVVNSGATLKLGTWWALGFGKTCVDLAVNDGGIVDINNQPTYVRDFALTGNATFLNIPAADAMLRLSGNVTATPTDAAAPSIPSLGLAGVDWGVSGRTNIITVNDNTNHPHDLVIGPITQFSAGGIRKAGTGTLLLTSANSYTGPTIVSGGALVVTDQSGTPCINSSALQFTGSTTLGVISPSSFSVPPIATAGNLSLDGVVTINIEGTLPGGYTALIKYNGTRLGTGGFVLGIAPAGTVLVDDPIRKAVYVLRNTGPMTLQSDLAGTTDYRYPGRTYQISVLAYGEGIHFQWFKNGTTPVGTDSAILTLSGLTSESAGTYSVILSDSVTSIFSATNRLVVLSTPMALASAPQAFWPLNEATGTTAYDQAGGHHATYGSAGVTYGVSGPVGNGVRLDGTNGQVAYPYSPVLNPSGPFTVEAWLNPAAVGGTMCPLGSFHDGVRSGWLLYVSTAGWNFRTYNTNAGNAAVNLTGGTPMADTWSHVAGVWDGTRGYLYVDGVLTQTSPETNFVANPDSAFTIGSRSDNNFRWGGTVSDVAFYNRALTALEIASHAQNAPVMQIGKSGNDLVVSYAPGIRGTLQSAPAVTGTYTNVPGATTPWTNTPTDGSRFWRVKF